MLSGKQRRVRVRVLVKAHPQPSQKYEETVCVAAITEDGQEMLRLYPIRYRHLSKDQQFDRFDLVEVSIEQAPGDFRPESRHVDESSITIISSKTSLSEVARVNLWRRFVVPTLKDLHAENVANHRSFGIIRPDAGSMRFFVEREAKAGASDRELNRAAFQQASLFDAPLEKLPEAEFAFGYRFTSGGHQHRHYIHDWEVQAAFINFRKRYGDDTLKMLKQEYGERIPTRNPHFVMGTMKAHPQTFIIIGILRSAIDPAELDKQSNLFE